MSERRRPKRKTKQAETYHARDEKEQRASFTPEVRALVDEFAALQPFPLDPFQVEAACQIATGRSVLVAAPTGTGKTIVAEFGIWLARQSGLRAIYTAPLKALSNQKFRDLCRRYDEQSVGLLTGDIVENPRAPIVVMTTEIYRNMLLEGCRAASTAPPEAVGELPAGIASQVTRPGVPDGRSKEESPDIIAADDVAELARQASLDEELSTVGCVVFDELHYLGDPGRGPVWEEAIIHSPAHMTLVGLSATVSNADELRRWIEHVHGSTGLVFYDKRAVPLEHYYFLDGQLHLVQDAYGKRVKRFPNVGGEAKLARARGQFRRYTTKENGRAESSTSSSGTAPDKVEQPKEHQVPEAGETLTALRNAELLPCIYFLPGRRAVEMAAESAKGHLLLSSEARARLQVEVAEWVARLPLEDQKLEQVQRLAALLPRGLAFHHAGLIPGLKMMVETLFQRGDLRAVFATDTLALGINMPARSVVLGSLSKFDGTQMRLFTPNEYQQLTGRAGRRGMDALGAAIIPYSPWGDAFEPTFAALTAPLLPVTSAFTIRYNSVLNLWRPSDQGRLRTALAASFREFQRRGGNSRSSGQTRVEYALRSSRATLPKTGQLSRAALAELEGTISVLRELRYIGADDELTIKGRLLRALFHPAGMILTELLVNGSLDGLTAQELAEGASWFTFDDDRSLRNTNYLSQRLIQLRREIQNARQRVASREYEEGLALSPGIIESFHGVALNWHRGFSLGGLLRRIDLAEGDILVALNQTIDLLQQLQGAVGQVLDTRRIWRERGAPTQYGRYLAEVQARLARLRPKLDAAWRGMLRGSVAQSRALVSIGAPGLSSPSSIAPLPDLIPPLAMAEDEDPDVARQDRTLEPDGSK
jgi:ATP-dependent RNA helicase HelY